MDFDISFHALERLRQRSSPDSVWQTLQPHIDAQELIVRDGQFSTINHQGKAIWGLRRGKRILITWLDRAQFGHIDIQVIREIPKNDLTAKEVF